MKFNANTNGKDLEEVKLVLEKSSNVDHEISPDKLKIDTPEPQKSLKVENAFDLLMMKSERQGKSTPKRRKKRGGNPRKL